MESRESPKIGVVPGDVLAGKYRVERVLGVGGMGVVVAAHHVKLDEKVALKFLLPQALASEDLVARFLREARAAVKIKSEHVARVIDVGELDNGSPYIVMEYLEGKDLSVWLREHGPLPIEQAVDFVLQASEAIADAHALGIVHRDIKPANLFCIERGDGQLSIKVLDFGVSKVTTPGAMGHDMTSSSALMGSPYYMSPEQMELSKGVDSRTDLWSLGVVLFELLTGRRPFQATAVTELAIKVANDPAPLLRSFRFDAPPGLELVIARCLEKDRAARVQDVGELAVALAEFGPAHGRVSVERVVSTLRRAGASGPPRAPSTPAAAARSPSPEAAHDTAASWGRTSLGARPRGKLIAGAAAGVALVALGLAALWATMGASAPTTAASAASPPPEAPRAGDAAASAEPPGPPPPVATPTASATPAPLQPGVRATPVAAPPKKPSCNPPFFIDPEGLHQYKPECL